MTKIDYDFVFLRFSHAVFLFILLFFFPFLLCVAVFFPPLPSSRFVFGHEWFAFWIKSGSRSRQPSQQALLRFGTEHVILIHKKRNYKLKHTVSNGSYRYPIFLIPFPPSQANLEEMVCLHSFDCPCLLFTLFHIPSQTQSVT